MYQQHCRGLAKLGHDECLHEAILKDLESEVLAWQEAGDKIIVLTDFNDDVRLPWIRIFFANLNLMEVLSELTGLLTTATHNRGSTTIDGIYVSPELFSAIKGGYLTFDAGVPSDHRVLWINLPGAILGFDEEYKLRNPSTQRLQCWDPRVVTKYVQHLSLSLTDANAFQRLDNLLPAISQNHLTRAQQQEYEELDRMVTTARLLAEKQCHKFKMGKVPWTPDLSKKIYCILYWKGVMAHALGRRVGTLVLRTRAHKAGFEHSLKVLQLPMETLQEKVSKATRQYRQLKKDPNRRDTWLGQIIEAQAQATGKNPKNYGSKSRAGSVLN